MGKRPSITKVAQKYKRSFLIKRDSASEACSTAKALSSFYSLQFHKCLANFLLLLQLRFDGSRPQLLPSNTISAEKVLLLPVSAVSSTSSHIMKNIRASASDEDATEDAKASRGQQRWRQRNSFYCLDMRQGKAIRVKMEWLGNASLGTLHNANIIQEWPLLCIIIILGLSKTPPKSNCILKGSWPLSQLLLRWWCLPFFFLPTKLTSQLLFQGARNRLESLCKKNFCFFVRCSAITWMQFPICFVVLKEDFKWLIHEVANARAAQ